MATNSKDKDKDKGKAISGAAIAAVTLALVTAIVVVSIMPIQSAHGSCITSAKGIACSGSGCGCDAHP